MPNGELSPAGDEKGSGALVSDTPSEVDRETNIRKAQLQGANRTYSTYMTYIHRQQTTDNLLLTTDQKTKCTRHKVQSSRANLSPHALLASIPAAWISSKKRASWTDRESIAHSLVYPLKSSKKTTALEIFFLSE